MQELQADQITRNSQLNVECNQEDQHAYEIIVQRKADTWRTLTKNYGGISIVTEVQIRQQIQLCVDPLR